MPQTRYTICDHRRFQILKPRIPHFQILTTLLSGATRASRLQLLRKKDDMITKSMDSNRGLVSALWRFPSELLSLIFAHCLPETEHFLPSSKLAPMLLTRICRRWREVATGMSSLWSRVIVDIDSEDWQRTAFCYNVWLERSRDRPLSLALKCFKDNTTYLRSLLEFHTNQISSLHIILFVNAFI